MTSIRINSIILIAALLLIAGNVNSQTFEGYLQADSITMVKLKGETGKSGTNGKDGVSPKITIGNTTTLLPGFPASVIQSGTPTDIILNFGIPQGQPGQNGSGGVVQGIRVVTNQAELKTALLDAAAGKVYFIQLANTIALIDSMPLPTQSVFNLEIYGAGVKDSSTNGLTALFYRNMPNLTEANKYTGFKPIFNNVAFKGKNRKGCAIGISSTYQATVVNCSFTGFNQALRFKFCLQPYIVNNTFKDCWTSIDLDFDKFPNNSGGNSTSQSNHPYIVNNKFRTLPGDLAGVRANALSGLYMVHNIDEGGDSLHNGSDYFLMFLDAGSNNVMDAYIGFNHNEVSHTVTYPKGCYYFNVKQGDYKIEGGYLQYPGTYLSVETKTQGGYPVFIIDRPVYLTNMANQKMSLGGGTQSGAGFQFINMPPQFDAFDATNWIGTAKPSEVYQFGRVSNGQKHQTRMGGWNKDTGVLTVKTAVFQ